jgi:hypothetical protein
MVYTEYCPARLKTAQLRIELIYVFESASIAAIRSPFLALRRKFIYNDSNLEVRIFLPFTFFTQSTISTSTSLKQDSRHNFERLFEIRDDIFDILNPYRHLHQTSRRHHH